MTRPTVRLRVTTPADVPALYQIQLDPEGNRMAGVKPRDWATFSSRWENIFAEKIVTPRVILADEVLAGSINYFKADGRDAVGYWLAREQWGKGIASKALALLLEEVPLRPLVARVAAHNPASLKVLQRCGFVITGRKHSPETERYIECEEISLLLA